MKKVFLAFVFLFASGRLVFATPPYDLQLKYDPVRQILEVNMKHPTVELREHYIRTITVTVNKQDPKIYRLPFQRSALEAEIAISLELKSADVVQVKATCSQGGSAEKELIIESPSQEDKK